MAAKHSHAISATTKAVCGSGLSKPECDRVWREYQHFHPGQRCVIRDEPAKKGKSKRVCVLEAQGKAAELARLHALFPQARGTIGDGPSSDDSLIVPEG